MQSTSCLSTIVLCLLYISLSRQDTTEKKLQSTEVAEYRIVLLWLVKIVTVIH